MYKCNIYLELLAFRFLSFLLAFAFFNAHNQKKYTLVSFPAHPRTIHIYICTHGTLLVVFLPQLCLPAIFSSNILDQATSSGIVSGDVGCAA